MTPYLLWIKLGAALALVAGIFGAGYHFGGLSSKAALEREHAAQLRTVATAYQTQLAALKANTAKQQVIIDEYDKSRETIDPIAVGIGHRVLKYALGTCGNTLPQTDPLAGRAQDAPGSANRAQEFERLFDDLAQAVGRDAAKQNALIQLAP